MKKAPILLLALLGFALNSCIVGSWDNHITGNGNVVEEDRNIDDFTAVHLSSGIDVLLSEGDLFEVVVEADENLLEYIETYKQGRTLVVGTEDHVNIGRAKAKRVHVTLPRLEDLRISSAGDCEGQTLFHCDDLGITISSAGDLSLELEAGKVDLDISSSGDCKLWGECDVFNVNLSSAGDLHAFDLIAGEVDVRVSSAGDARVHATDRISMRASSAGDIYYTGDAEVLHKSKSSAGDIVKR